MKRVENEGSPRNLNLNQARVGAKEKYPCAQIAHGGQRSSTPLKRPYIGVWMKKLKLGDVINEPMTQGILYTKATGVDSKVVRWRSKRPEVRRPWSRIVKANRRPPRSFFNVAWDRRLAWETYLHPGRVVSVMAGRSCRLWNPGGIYHGDGNEGFALRPASA